MAEELPVVRVERDQGLRFHKLREGLQALAARLKNLLETTEGLQGPEVHHIAQSKAFPVCIFNRNTPRVYTVRARRRNNSHL